MTKGEDVTIQSIHTRLFSKEKNHLIYYIGSTLNLYFILYLLYFVLLLTSASKCHRRRNHCFPNVKLLKLERRPQGGHPDSDQPRASKNNIKHM